MKDLEEGAFCHGWLLKMLHLYLTINNCHLYILLQFQKSANIVKRIQRIMTNLKWYCYQSYYLSGNRNITSGEHLHYYLRLDIYCHSPHWIDTKPEIIMELLCTTILRNTSIVRYGVFLVTILFLDFFQFIEFNKFSEPNFWRGCNMVIPIDTTLFIIDF